MKKILLCFFVLLIAKNILGSNKTIDFSINKIPKNLLTNANSVIRNESVNIVVERVGKVKIWHEKTITILNERGADEAQLMIGKDGYTKVRKVRGELFDVNNISIKKIAKDDVMDFSSDADVNQITDERFVAASLTSDNYPYTVIYTYEEDLSGYFNYFENSLIGFNQSLQTLQITLTEPEDFKSKSVIYNFRNSINSTEIIKDKRIKKWQFENINAIKKSSNLPTIWLCLPMIVIAPEEFIIEQHKGKLTSWNAFGQWVYDLNKEESELNTENKTTVIQLVKNCKTDKEKIDKIYSYLQTNCRYVNTSLGIGGFKACDANITHKNKFGDCKALSVYMKSMLNAVGISSNLALVFGGKNFAPVTDSFVFNAFNHVILNVPLAHDTVWLDCTSNKLIAGKLGSFTCDRQALLLEEQTSHLVATPQSKYSDNAICSITSLNIEHDKSVVLKSNCKVTGDYSGAFLLLKNNAYEHLLNGYLQSLFSLKNIMQKDISIYEPLTNYDTLPVMLNFKTDLNDYSSDDRIFINPFFQKNSLADFNSINLDKNIPINFPFKFKNQDSLEINIPENFELESLLSNAEEHFDFFDFKQQFNQKLDLKKIIVSQTFILKQNFIPQNQIPKFIESLKQLNFLLSKKIVLKKIA